MTKVSFNEFANTYHDTYSPIEYDRTNSNLPSLSIKRQRYLGRSFLDDFINIIKEIKYYRCLLSSGILLSDEDYIDDYIDD